MGLACLRLQNALSLYSILLFTAVLGLAFLGWLCVLAAGPLARHAASHFLGTYLLVVMAVTQRPSLLLLWLPHLMCTEVARV